MQYGHTFTQYADDVNIVIPLDTECESMANLKIESQMQRHKVGAIFLLSISFSLVNLLFHLDLKLFSQE